MAMKREIGLLFIIGLFTVAACNGDSKPGSTGSGESEGVVKSALAQDPNAAVERIVFVGKKDACDCTREQIDSTWKALQSVLEGGPAIAVKRIQVDVDVEEANRYHALRPLVALPGLYFLDGKNQLIQVLQGELRVDEIAEILQ